MSQETKFNQKNSKHSHCDVFMHPLIDSRLNSSSTVHAANSMDTNLVKNNHSALARSPTRKSIDSQSMTENSIYSQESQLQANNQSNDLSHNRLASIRSAQGLRKYASTLGQQSTASGQSGSNDTYLQSREKFLQAIDTSQILRMESSALGKIPVTVVDELLELSMDAGLDDFKTDDRKVPIRKLSTEMKLSFIKQVYEAIKKESSETVEKTPKFFVECLKEAVQYMEWKNGNASTQNISQMIGAVFNRTLNRPAKQIQSVKDVLSELQVCCTRQSVSWVSEFVDLKGLELLFELLSELHLRPERKEKHFELEVEILRIIRAVISQERGIYDVFYHPKPLADIVICLESPYASAKTFASELLLILTTLDYPTGHQLVMKSFQQVAQQKEETRCFRTLVKAINDIVESRGVWGTNVGAKRMFTLKDSGRGYESSLKETKEFLTASISLIRYIIEIPIDIAYRMHLRQEFSACGMNQVFKALKTWPPDEFPRVFCQIKDIEDLSQVDLDEFVSSMDFILDLDVENPHSVLDALFKCFEKDENSVCKVQGQEYILSILKHLLIPAQIADGKIRLKYFAFIDTLIAQIGMDQKGITPDFTDLYNVPVDMIVRDLKALDDYEDVTRELKELRVKCYDLEHGEKDSLATHQRDKKIISELTSKLDSLNECHESLVKEHEEQLNRILDSVSKQNFTSKGLLESTGSFQSDSAFASTGSMGTSGQLASSALHKNDSAYGSVKTLQASFHGDKEQITALSSSDSLNTIDQSAGIGATLGTLSLPFPPAMNNNIPPPPPLPSSISNNVPPPPPPPFTSNNVPPPPPPPFMSSNAPPAPGIIPQPPTVAPRFQQFKPSVPTKRVQWEKTPENILEKTIWSQQIQLQTQKSNENLEFMLEKEGILESLEQDYAIKRPQKLESTSVSTFFVEKIEIMSSKAAQNIMIVLKKAAKAMKIAQLKTELLKMNDSVWTEELVKAVIDCMPSKDEMATILSRKDEVDRMREAEAFYCQMSQVPHLTQVLCCVKFKLMFQEKYLNLISGFDTLLSAFKSLKSAIVFPKLLELILTIGNYLNTGGFNGNVHGFKLSSIRKLVDTKMTNGRGTLLNSVAKILMQKFPEYVDFLQELEPFNASSKISVNTLKQETSMLSQELNSTINVFKQVLCQSSNLDSFNQLMSKFLEFSTLKISECTRKQTELQKLFEETVVYYGDPDPSKIQMSDYVNILKDFCLMFEQNLALLQKEREKVRLRESKKTAVSRLTNAADIPKPLEKRSSTVEDLLESLKQGNAHARVTNLRKSISETSEINGIATRKVSIGIDNVILQTQQLLKGLDFN